MDGKGGAILGLETTRGPLPVVPFAASDLAPAGRPVSPEVLLASIGWEPGRDYAAEQAAEFALVNPEKKTG